MNFSRLGDLAQSYSMQSRNATLKHDIERLTQELASGQTADIRATVGVNTAYVDDLERSLTKLDGFDLATQEASQLAEGAQLALGRIHDVGSAFRSTLLMASSSALGETTTSIIAQAGTALEDVVAALNTDFAGRALFSGTATDTKPLVSAQALRDALGAAVSGAGTVDDIIAAAEAWFDDPAGFGSIAYQGSDTSLAPIAISEQERAKFDLRADDPVLRDTLRNLALIALSDDPALALTPEQQGELVRKTTDAVFAANDDVLALQTKVGLSQEQLASRSVRNSAERSTLEMARNDLRSIDPFEAATELEQVQFQLQSLYAITSRMSQLSLVNFL